MRATTLSLWTSSPAHRGYSTSTDIPPRSVLRSGLGRNPGYRNLICVLRSASARGNNSGCSQGLGSNLLTGSEHQGLADLIPDATTIINPASPQVPLPLHFSGSAKTDGELASALAPVPGLPRARRPGCPQPRPVRVMPDRRSS